MTQNVNNPSNLVKITGITAFMSNAHTFFSKICGMCLLAEKDNLRTLFTDSVKLRTKDVSLCEKLYYCCPELDLRIKSKTICENCFVIINIIYEFIRKYEKPKSEFHEHFLSDFPSIQNFDLLERYRSTGQDKIKIEKVDLSDSEGHILNKLIQTQSIAKAFNGSENNFIEAMPLKYDYSCTMKTASKDHLYEKLFRCSLCKYSSTKMNDLKTHLENHTAKKLIKCSECDYSCTHPSILRIHFKIHTGEKPYRCSVCDYGCIQKSNLRRHLKTHTGEKPFTCSLCNYSCKDKSSLNTHMKIHSGEKPFACSVCNYYCKLKSLNLSPKNAHWRETFHVLCVQLSL